MRVDGDYRERQRVFGSGLFQRGLPDGWRLDADGAGYLIRTTREGQVVVLPVKADNRPKVERRR